jgi:hypothetical protein
MIDRIAVTNSQTVPKGGYLLAMDKMGLTGHRSGGFSPIKGAARPRED